MMKMLLLIALMFASTSNAQGLPACPDRGADPTKFCPVGMQWSEATQSCVSLV